MSIPLSVAERVSHAQRHACNWCWGQGRTLPWCPALECHRSIWLAISVLIPHPFFYTSVKVKRETELLCAWNWTFCLWGTTWDYLFCYPAGLCPGIIKTVDPGASREETWIEWRNRVWIQDRRKLGILGTSVGESERAARTELGLLCMVDGKKAPEVNHWLKKKAIWGSLSINSILFLSCPVPQGCCYRGTKTQGGA